MFCDCGTIITYSTAGSSKMSCKRCGKSIKAASDVVITTKHIFVHQESFDVEKIEGAKIKMKCPNCGVDEVSYNSAQLRSADEGQTVFYSCTKCGWKETVQS